MSTKINWTDETWNPIIGCSKVSDGCKNCYAEKMSKRLAGIHKTSYYLNVVKGEHYATPQAKILPEWSGKTHFQESQLEKPLKWKKPRMVFVCSMGDLFHESVPFEWQFKVFQFIVECPQHTFQVLTKRPDIMKKRIADINFHLKRNYPKLKIPLQNVWLGVTSENQEQANKRIPILLQIPAKVRFVSVEPMLGAVDLENLEYERAFKIGLLNSFSGHKYTHDNDHLGKIDKLDWVICGGESGHNARPMHPDWVRSLRDQCKDANVPFFFKQWGEWHESDLQENKGCKTHLWKDGKLMYKIGKNKAGCLIDGKEYKEFPII